MRSNDGDEGTQRFDIEPRRLVSVFENIADLVTVIDARGNMLYISPNAESVVGRRIDERLGESIFEHVHPDDVGYAAERLMEGLITPGFAEPFEVRLQHADGSYRVFEVSGNNQLDNPDVQGVILNSRDVTDRRRQEISRHQIETRFQQVFENAAVGMNVVHPDGRYMRANAAFCRLVGCEPHELSAYTIYDMSHPDDVERTREAFTRMVAGERSQYMMEKRLRRVDGSFVWTQVSASIVRGDDGEPRYAVGQVIDISERHELAERLVHEATHDHLTGLATRGLLGEHMDRCLAHYRRSGETFATLFVDLDGFKAVNDTFGHIGGDTILKEVARRLRKLVRASDLVARLGGDEFVIVLSHLNTSDGKDVGDALDVAQRVVDSIRAPYVGCGAEVRIGASVAGIALARDVADESSDLIARADLAAYRAKRGGKGDFVLFDD